MISKFNANFLNRNQLNDHSNYLLTSLRNFRESVKTYRKYAMTFGFCGVRDRRDKRMDS